MAERMSHEETLRFIAAAQAGDKEAKERLVCDNLALVRSVVRSFLGRGAEYEDLLQLGSMGLVKAICGYDASFGVRFSTYAVPMISGEIKRFLRDDGLVKVSRSLKENAQKVFRAQELYQKENGEPPGVEELSRLTGMESEEIVHCIEAVRSPVSLYETAFDDSEKTLLIDTMAAQEEDTDAIDRILLRELIGSLPVRERKLIALRFFSDKTQSEIAQILGVSQVQVSRLLTKTIEKLRKSLA